MKFIFMQFFTNNGNPYSICTSDNVSVEIISPSQSNSVVPVIEYLGEDKQKLKGFFFLVMHFIQYGV